MNSTFKFQGTLNGRQYDDLDEFLHAVKSTSQDDITDFDYSVNVTKTNTSTDEPKQCNCTDDSKAGADSKAGTPFRCEQIEEVTDTDEVAKNTAEKMLYILNNSGLTEDEKDSINNIIACFYDIVNQVYTNYEKKEFSSFTGFRIDDKLARLQYRIARLTAEARQVLSHMMYDNVTMMIDSISDEISDAIDHNTHEAEENEKLLKAFQDEYDKLVSEEEEEYRALSQKYETRKRQLNDSINKSYRINAKTDEKNMMYSNFRGVFNRFRELFEI